MSMALKILEHASLPNKALQADDHLGRFAPSVLAAERQGRWTARPLGGGLVDDEHRASFVKLGALATMAGTPSGWLRR
jgi:hypothetical protein